MWKKLFEILKCDKNFEWLIIDSSYVKIQLGLVVEIRPYQRQKGAQFKKLYLAVNERGLPVKFIVTEGKYADYKEAINLLKNLDAKLVFADCAYDTNEILSYIAKRNIKSKRDRLEQRGYNRKFYRFRHIIENTFLAFKCWRGIAT